MTCLWDQCTFFGGAGKGIREYPKPGGNETGYACPQNTPGQDSASRHRRRWLSISLWTSRFIHAYDLLIVMSCLLLGLVVFEIALLLSCWAFRVRFVRGRGLLCYSLGFLSTVCSDIALVTHQEPMLREGWLERSKKSSYNFIFIMIHQNKMLNVSSCVAESWMIGGSGTTISHFGTRTYLPKVDIDPRLQASIMSIIITMSQVVPRTLDQCKLPLLTE